MFHWSRHWQLVTLLEHFRMFCNHSIPSSNRVQWCKPSLIVWTFEMFLFDFIHMESQTNSDSFLWVLNVTYACDQLSLAIWNLAFIIDIALYYVILISNIRRVCMVSVASLQDTTLANTLHTRWTPQNHHDNGSSILQKNANRLWEW